MSKRDTELEDGEMDDYIAQLLAQRAKQQKERAELYGYSAYLGEPTKLRATNKRFLLNTIKNTSSYNDSLRRREERQKVSKKATTEKRTEIPRRQELKGIEFDESNPSSAFSSRLRAMVQHSRLSSKTKRAKLPSGKSIMEAVLGSCEDQGIYGSNSVSATHDKLHRGEANNKPNRELPEKCPW
jgi:hypothetical protein